ncbi:hypothetical protein MANES_07G047501v8 [Manihot esculenta]|uniref:Uncharacterized protein n=1 Tax=Manihot esculenta TaxID=3983 RepID=A0ACC8DCF8_MANES|nr:hypothetical protein MANES_07G047501v8 [Manihot esculenta]
MHNVEGDKNYKAYLSPQYFDARLTQLGWQQFHPGDCRLLLQLFKNKNLFFINRCVSVSGFLIFCVFVSKYEYEDEALRHKHCNDSSCGRAYCFDGNFSRCSKGRRWWRRRRWWKGWRWRRW